jgi:LytS/YehU family sensor histidine kinase
MNPHFIFNCLSSINSFVLENKTDTASDYLTRFSKLIRTVLGNSKRDLISLEDELEMLRLYLEMEMLRFKNAFTYCIEMEKNIDPTEIYIPPLLLQPFAENAIWHGLMHKEGPGRLDIRIYVKDHILTCVITDDGVGRSFAMSLRGGPAGKRKSMGLQITGQRIDLINGDMLDGANSFCIEDLYHKEGEAAGTRVSLKIKFKETMDENS